MNRSSRSSRSCRSSRNCRNNCKPQNYCAPTANQQVHPQQTTPGPQPKERRLGRLKAASGGSRRKLLAAYGTHSSTVISACAGVERGVLDGKWIQYIPFSPTLIFGPNMASERVCVMCTDYFPFFPFHNQATRGLQVASKPTCTSRTLATTLRSDNRLEEPACSHISLPLPSQTRNAIKN